MTIELLPGDYILGFWFAEDKDKNNWFSCIKKAKDSAEWDVRYRFRYNVDDKIFNSKDKRSWYHFISRGQSEDEMLATHELVFSVVKVRYPFGDSLIIKDFNSATVMNRLMGLPWFHLDKKRTDRMNKKTVNPNKEN